MPSDPRLLSDEGVQEWLKIVRLWRAIVADVLGGHIAAQAAEIARLQAIREASIAYGLATDIRPGDFPVEATRAIRAAEEAWRALRAALAAYDEGRQ